MPNGVPANGESWSLRNITIFQVRSKFTCIDSTSLRICTVVLFSGVTNMYTNEDDTPPVLFFTNSITDNSTQYRRVVDGSRQTATSIQCFITVHSNAIAV